MQHHIIANCSRVEVWTDTLPYCGALPKISALRRRQPYYRGLCAAIRKLDLNASGALQATWTTDAQDANHPDVENLLIWDVASTVGNVPVTHFLRFERRNEAPQPPPDVRFKALHHIRYEVIPRDQISQPYASDRVLARCSLVRCNRDDLTKTAKLWSLFKPNIERTRYSDKWPHGNQFNVQITVSGPQNGRVNRVNSLANSKLVKGTVDGFISALHCYDGGKDDQLDSVSDRIAVRLGGQATEWRELLLDQSNAVLGPRRVPHLHGNGLAWSPADHLLVRGEIIRQPCTDSHWSIAGKLIVAG
jgi:hypothetical protein